MREMLDDEFDDGSSTGVGGHSIVSSVMREFNASHSEKSKNEDCDDVLNLYAGLDKISVLQEASAAFNNPQLVKLQPNKCSFLLTKLLYLLSQGERFEGRDAESVFFAVTKLFQSSNTSLRRMTYLFIKEVAETTDPENVIIVIQSLTKDMNSNVDLYRANAIRVLCKIIDPGILGQIDRYIKEAIVDRSSIVSVSALVSGNRMAKNPLKMEVIRRWSNEVQEAVTSKSEMVQFHALALLYQIKRHDRLAVERIISQCHKSSVSSPMVMLLLIRYTAKLLHDDAGIGSSNPRVAYELLEHCLHNRSDIVILEAARTMCRLPEVGPQDIMPPVTVLQHFLCSPKPLARFAAIRTLHEVALKHPNVIARANQDIELLIGDCNKSVATLAVATLLKTGSEDSVDKLMKKIAGFIADISDEFKIVIVRAVHSLCLKYSSKHRVVLILLSSILRNEGGFEFKQVLVDTILNIVENIPDCKETGLFHLCEFIEDCEFAPLSAQILHVLGEMGPTTTNPAKYIRFIYNRIILENAHVRSAAISALGKFGLKVNSLTNSIKTLLRRSLTDEDDDVRDRAVMFLYVLESTTKSDGSNRSILTDPLPMDPKSLTRALEIYKQRPAPGPVTFESLPVVDEEPVRDIVHNTMGGLSALDGQDVILSNREEPELRNHNKMTNSELPSDTLFKVPEFAHLGSPFRFSKPTQLTESETEYLVSCVKHVFVNHIILQFNVINTLNDQRLVNVSALVEDPDCEDWEMEYVKNCDFVAYNNTGQVFVLLRRPENVYSASFAVELRFNVQECDPATGEPYDEDDPGEEEEYPVEPLDVDITDFVAKVQVNNFKSAWEAIGKDKEVLAKFDLPHYKTLKGAVGAVVDLLGLRPCEGSDVTPHKATSQIVLLSGSFLGGSKVLVRPAFAITQTGGLQLKVAIRADDEFVAQLLMDCIQ